MMAGQAQSSNGKRQYDWDDPVVLLSIMGIFGFLAWAIWYLFHTQIATGYVYLRYAQLYLFYVIGSSLDIWPLDSAAAWVEKYCAPESLGMACTRDFSQVKWDEISGSAVWFNVISLIILFVSCLLMFRSIVKHHPDLKFSKKHDLTSFMAEVKDRYPHLRVFTKIDLISKPLDHPIFGMSLTTRQFAKRKFLIRNWQEQEDGWLPIIDVEKTKAVFTLQLGNIWRNVDGLTPSETLLLAIAMPRVAASDTTIPDEAYEAAKADTDKMLDWCWEQFVPEDDIDDKDDSWLCPDIDLTLPRAIIHKYIGTPTVQRVFKRHAYVRTIIWEMFTQARRLGVLAPCEMRWMRFYDREAWYLLQSIMRPSSFSEAPGTHCHYFYEAKSGEPIVEPQVIKAVSGLEEMIQSYLHSKEDMLAYEADRKLFLKAEQERLLEVARKEPAAPRNLEALKKEISMLKQAQQEPMMRLAADYIAWLKDDALFLDTETTGLGVADQVIQIGLVSLEGEVVLNETLRPSVPIHAEASKVHGITMPDLAECPQWPAIHDRFLAAIDGRQVLIFNAEFDVRLLTNTTQAFGLAVDWQSVNVRCVMKDARAAYEMEKNPRLSFLIEDANIKLEGAAHDAIYDATALQRWVISICRSYRSLEIDLRQAQAELENGD